MKIEPSDPIEHSEPDFDPGLEPDPKHKVEENPPENAGPAKHPDTGSSMALTPQGRHIMPTASDDSAPEPRDATADEPAGATPIDNESAIGQDTVELDALTDDPDSDEQTIENAEGVRDHDALPADEEIPD